MGYESVSFPTGGLLTHQQLSQLAENDDHLSTVWGNYKRPALKYVSGTIVTCEENSDETEETKIIEHDEGDTLLSNGSDTSRFRGCDLTKTLDFTSSLPQSGLHSSYTLTDNTWYHIYAIKTTHSSQLGKFVLAAEEDSPVKLTDTDSLSAKYGAFGWYYLGTIRYGDSVSAPSAILDFVMSNGLTLFKNTVTGNSGIASMGIQLATTPSTSVLTYTHSEGGGDLEIPANIDLALYNAVGPASLNNITIRDSADAIEIARSVGGYSQSFELPATLGLALSIPAAPKEILLSGFRDGFFQPDHNKRAW